MPRHLGDHDRERVEVSRLRARSLALAGSGAVVACLLTAPAAAVSVYKGLEPGKSTKADAAAALGGAVREPSPGLAEYPPQPGTGPILVEFAGEPPIVARIEVAFVKAISRAAMVKSLALPETAEFTDTTSEGKLVEGYGGLKSIVFTFARDQAKSGVKSIAYLSRDRFERMRARVLGTDPTSGPTSLKDFTPGELKDLLKPLSAEPALGAELTGQLEPILAAAMTNLVDGDAAAALRNLTRAVKLAPRSAVANYNLSILYEHREQIVSARQHAAAYLEILPAAKDRGAVTARIARLDEAIKLNPRVRFDPQSCHDLYVWSQGEYEVARKAKKPARRQAILEIRVTAQQGDCVKARELVELYRQSWASGPP